MRTSLHERSYSTRSASFVGVAVGLGVLALSVVGGLVVARWSVADFLAHSSVEMGLALLLATGLAVAIFAVPVAAFLRFGLVAPLAVLGVVVAGWLVLGAASGLLSGETVFGLAAYAFYASPLYVVAYAVVGGVEYSFRE